MNKSNSVLAATALLFCGAGFTAVGMEGEVTLDYYVAEVDAEGYELAEMEFYVERVVNDAGARSGPLSLGGWLTRDPNAGGSGTEAAYLPLGSLPGNSALEVWDTADAEDVPPGEYYVHTLLQDDRFADSFEDSRTLSPRLLWRGGLEAVGPLDVYSYDGGRRLSVDLGTLRNNRLDSRYTNDIVLTLYATYGFGPASDGFELCEVRVPGLYAGEQDHHAGFDCTAAPVPDGEYTLHLTVAEVGGRGGSSTLSGPDAYFAGGRLDHLEGEDGYVYYAGALQWWALLPLLGLMLARRFRR